MYATLRLPRTMTAAQRIGIVQDILDVLDIKRIQHSLIGSAEKRGISGGQRKRVNIGMEMVGDPSLLFLGNIASDCAVLCLDAFSRTVHVHRRRRTHERTR